MKLEHRWKKMSTSCAVYYAIFLKHKLVKNAQSLILLNLISKYFF